MKKVYYIASMSLLLGFSACNNDFMDLYPEDKINDETYWKTESDLKNFANQFYTTLASLLYFQLVEISQGGISGTLAEQDGKMGRGIAYMGCQVC